MQTDEEFLNEYCEKGFSERVLKNIKHYKELGYKFTVEEDVNGIQGEVRSRFL